MQTLVVQELQSLAHENSAKSRVIPGYDDPSDYSAADLGSRCRLENQRFRCGEAHYGGYALEIFRRAIVDQDEHCWQALHAIYHAQVFAWCHRAGANSGTSTEDLVALTWEKFWYSFGPEKLAQAEGTAAVQSYLKACAQSTAIDVVRERSHGRVSLDEPLNHWVENAPTLGESLIDPRPSPEDVAIEREDRESLWSLVERQLSNQVERILFHLRYEVGLTSARIYELRPDLFSAVEDVYRINRNILDRLRRCPELPTWLQS